MEKVTVAGGDAIAEGGAEDEDKGK
jgi:hypothetical protein